MRQRLKSASLEDSSFHTIGLGAFSIAAYERINSMVHYWESILEKDCSLGQFSSSVY